MPRLKWNGTGTRYIEVPVPPRGVVELHPGWNEVTHAELDAMRPHIQLELAAGMIEIHREREHEPVRQVPAPGVVEAIGETEETTSSTAPAANEPEATAKGTEPDPLGRISVLDELLAKTDAELAEIAKEYGVKKRFLEKRENLAKAIMVAAGYKVEEPPVASDSEPAAEPAAPETPAPAEPQQPAAQDTPAADATPSAEPAETAPAEASEPGAAAPAPAPAEAAAETPAT